MKLKNILAGLVGLLLVLPAFAGSVSVRLPDEDHASHSRDFASGTGQAALAIGVFAGEVGAIPAGLRQIGGGVIVPPRASRARPPACFHRASRFVSRWPRLRC